MLYERDMLNSAVPSSLRAAPSLLLLKLGAGAMPAPAVAVEKHGWALWVLQMGVLEVGPVRLPVSA